MSFEQLLNDLEELKKSQVNDEEGDEKIRSAAAGSDEDEDEDDEECEGKGEMTKSFTAIIDGEEHDCVDGTVLVKSLQADISRIDGERATENEHLSKSLLVVTDLLKEQGDMIKSLQDQIAKLSDSGRGRKSTVAVDSDMAKSLAKQETPKAEDILAKCEQAMRAGKISAMDVSMAEASVNRGMQVPAHIMANLS